MGKRIINGVNYTGLSDSFPPRSDCLYFKNILVRDETIMEEYKENASEIISVAVDSEVDSLSVINLPRNNYTKFYEIYYKAIVIYKLTVHIKLLSETPNNKVYSYNRQLFKSASISLPYKINGIPVSLLYSNESLEANIYIDDIFAEKTMDTNIVICVSGFVNLKRIYEATKNTYDK